MVEVAKKELPERIASLEDVCAVLKSLDIPHEKLVLQRPDSPITARVGDTYLLFTEVNGVTVGVQISELNGERSPRYTSFLLSSVVEIRTDTNGNPVWRIIDGSLGEEINISTERVVFGSPVLGEQRV